jgi:hypothetical protein
MPKPRTDRAAGVPQRACRSIIAAQEAADAAGGATCRPRRSDQNRNGRLGCGLIAILTLLWSFAVPQAVADEPALPEGLGPADAEPALPSGLGTPSPPPSMVSSPALMLDWSGFLDVRAGWRLRSDPAQRSRSLSEARLQLQLDGRSDRIEFRLVGDLIYDDLSDTDGIDLQTGEGPIDLREANAAWRPDPLMDIKVGRQVLSWGTGDLVFINDLFPKDYRAFFLGRDIEYLKAPSDAGKVSLFFGGANLDLVYMPTFEPDRFIDGSRLSFFNPFVGQPAGRSNRLRVRKPKGPEFAMRLYGNIGAYELAAYGYHGYWKSPAGYIPPWDAAIFPALSVYGFSVRGQGLGGIANLEAGYYDSRDDRDGDDPLVRNSELRVLVGYQRELIRDFTLGIQSELEHMLDYGGYRQGLPSGAPVMDRNRYLLTLRLNRQLLDQDLTLSLFTFYSPTDQDAYLRPRLHYRLNDYLSWEIGANLFFGNRRDTFFGQLQDNSNLYFAIRGSFAAGVRP